MKTDVLNAHTKYTILKHALKENNVSETCKLFGISRTTFYNWNRAYQKKGMSGLEMKGPQKPKMPNKVKKEVEQEILSFVAKYPEDGPKRIYYELRAEGHEIGESGIYNVLKRHDLTKKSQRIDYSTNKALHEKNNRKVKKREADFEHIREAYPGYLVLQRIDFMGSYHGIGKIYQYSLYDTTSKWGLVKLYNKKQDIDVWHYFELKLAYLMKTFNLNIENLMTERSKTFVPFFVKGNKFKEIIEHFQIKHMFITPDNHTVLDEMKEFNQYLIAEFYNEITTNSHLDSFLKVEQELIRFLRIYNFSRVISNGDNAGKTPAEVVLERASQNNVDLDTLPLWILALLKSARRGDENEK